MGVDKLFPVKMTRPLPTFSPSFEPSVQMRRSDGATFRKSSKCRETLSGGLLERWKRRGPNLYLGERSLSNSQFIPKELHASLRLLAVGPVWSKMCDERVGER